VVIAVCRAPEPPLGDGQTMIDHGREDAVRVSCELHGRAGVVAGSASVIGATGILARRSISVFDVGELWTS
jgi:hypothetical protein